MKKGVKLSNPSRAQGSKFRWKRFTQPPPLFPLAEFNGYCAIISLDKFYWQVRVELADLHSLLSECTLVERKSFVKGFVKEVTVTGSKFYWS